MTMTLVFSQVIPAPVDRVRRFFADVTNLAALTPSFPRMEVVGDERNIAPGREFLLRFTAGPVVVHWRSRIEQVDDDGSFVDMFSGGPFRIWRHRHSFLDVPGGTCVNDEVTCTPAWWFRPAAGLFVRMLFAYRRRVLGRIAL